MKKLLALLLASVLCTMTVASCAPAEDSGDTTGDDANTSSEGDTSGDDAEVTEVALDTLLVGTPEMNGDFINDFGNSSYDLAVKTLTGGYADTYYQTDAGELALNETVVTNLDVATDDAGNKTYTFTLNESLKWNNGDPIMASDYVGAVLWKASPEWATAGASSTLAEGILGYSAYLDASTTTLAGIQLLGDYQFSVTIAAEKLPYYWESSYVMISPIHMATYAPGATVTSDANGASFTYTEGDLASDTARIAETERFAPTVTCGPYTFVSYENQTVTLELNENFIGDVNGEVPTLKNIVVKAIPQDTDVDWVINGEVDLVSGVVEGEKIEKAKASETAQLHSYLRAGFGNLAMHTDFGATADVNVRWALASLIDRNEVVDYVLGGYGSTVDGAFGAAQWMYQDKQADLQAELKPISFNLDAANDYLDQSEWKFEADGTTAFDATKAQEDGSYLRHNAAGEKLVINHLGTTDNTVTDIIEIQYAANAPLAGIEFNVTKSDFNALLDAYYYGYDIPEDERVYNTFNLATNFTAVDDKFLAYHSSLLGTWQNSTQLNDAELDEIMVRMRETDPSDDEAYLQAWFEFQIRWNELMPEVPLYSNEYFDISHVNVDNLNTTPYASWYEIICQISKSEK